ncbi:DNA primase [Cryobacterium sp. Hh7]|uniref:DNA primase n=1 Tax=Cryobacterium sp. Hh7 TaxID=1259159 RepID=UPI00106B9568|nr:DNA primase [Cryobacterium sp. Hh7]TFD58023.1 DNA primase [Cryobacterium sp. Hh7]
MEFTRCEHCGILNALSRSGARFCSPKCRVYWHRAAGKLPSELTSHDRWIRRSAEKVPLQLDGRAASSTRSSTWSSFKAASASTVGAGLGFVLNGDGIGCYDLDHCMVGGKLTPTAAAFIASHPGFYSEVSPSGDGVHIWVHAEGQRGSKRVIDGLNVEFYTRGRYITITGKAIKTTA